MSSTSDYIDLLTVIQAIPTNEVLTPTIPIDVYVQETENLWQWCKDDQSALEAAGLDWNFVASLPVRAGACREAQSLWNKERNVRKKAEKDWKEQSPQAFDLRNQLVHTYRYAFRKDSTLLDRVEEIALGDTNADMVQDLNDLAVLGRNNPGPLQLIRFDVTLLDQASQTADEMGELLGIVNGERQTDSETMIIRDKAYTFLKQAVDEVRECGKFVFWRNPDRLKGYVSDFWQKRNTVKAKETPVA
jgi:hypothetical protein